MLDDLSVAVLFFDRMRRCRFANDRARMLFSEREPTGQDFAALFSDWPSAPAPPPVGQAGAVRAQAGAAPAQTRAAPAQHVAGHADGRLFAADLTAAEDGGLCLALVEIGTRLHSAEPAARDSLTGLVQRDALRRGLDAHLAAAARDGSCVAVHCVDLDRFKHVNDTLGHSMGDALLVKAAERLRSLAGSGDIAARLGGDEFVLVQGRASDRDAARALGDRIADLVGRTYALQGHMVDVGASVGVATYPADGETAEVLMKHADLALYRAKADGRGIARLFEPSMSARLQARRFLEIDLRRALALRQFHLCFQPQVQLASDRVVGFEALLRWTHPERGPVSPAEFIPLAEELGLIIPIGEWVIRIACREAAAWAEPATVAVNVSSVQFKGGKLVPTVMSALAQTGLDPARLELEITEGALLEETNLVLRALHDLRALGVKVSMDDFGTGYSSLSYLRKFPFDKIKIDQTFIRGLGGSNDCDAIVRAVATLGASLGMRTTAEGVETPDQLARVRSEGCTEVQGFLTGRPLAPEEAAALLDQQTRR